MWKFKLNKSSLDFYNVSEIKIVRKWYSFSLKLNKRANKFILLQIPRLDETKIIKTNDKDEYVIKSINLKIKIIWFLLNGYLKKKFHGRKKTAFIFFLAFLLSLIYYVINAVFNNIIINFISNSLFFQTILMFLTFSSFINIFFPFTIRKEISQKDVENISEDKTKETLDKIKKDEDEIKYLEKYSTF